jgi:hypothetical protein
MRAVGSERAASSAATAASRAGLRCGIATRGGSACRTRLAPRRTPPRSIARCPAARISVAVVRVAAGQAALGRALTALAENCYQRCPPWGGEEGEAFRKIVRRGDATEK